MAILLWLVCSWLLLYAISEFGFWSTIVSIIVVGLWAYLVGESIRREMKK